MKKTTLKTLLMAALLCSGSTGAVAQVTSLPYTADFEDGTIGDFSAGRVPTGDAAKNIGNVLAIPKGTAILSFDSDTDTEGNQPYTLSENENLTFAYKAYHGWLKDRATTVSIKNSAGVSLVQYTYNHGDCKVSDVTIGGETASGFSAFSFQSKCANGRNANGFTGNRYPYAAADANNPKIKMTVTSVGYVEISFVCTDQSVDKTFCGMLPDGVALDVASFEITSNVDNADREYAIDNLSITTETKALTKVDYTVKRVCGGTEIASTTLSAVAGITIAADKSAYYDEEEKKYIYDSDDFSTVGVVADGNVYTITYHEAAATTYTLKNDLGTVLMDVSGWEGDDKYGYYPKFELKGAELYSNEAANNGYNEHKVTLAATNITETKKTTLVSNQCVYYKEAEDIEGATILTGSNAPARCSNGKGARFTTDVNVITLPAGEYKISGAVWGPRGTEFSVMAGEEKVWANTTSGSLNPMVGNAFTLKTATTLTIPAAGTNYAMLDYIYIIKTAEVASVSSVGYATFVPSTNVVVPAGVTVYTAKVNDDKASLALTAVAEGTVLGAGQGFIVKAEENTYNFAVTTEEAATLDNDLLAADAPIEVSEESNIYVLAQPESSPVGFYRVKAGTIVAAGKAYIELTAAKNAAPALTFADSATGISEVKTAGVNAATADFYTLQGVKVNKNTRGLLLHNGKKYLVK